MKLSSSKKILLLFAIVTAFLFTASSKFAHGASFPTPTTGGSGNDDNWMGMTDSDDEVEDDNEQEDLKGSFPPPTAVVTPTVVAPPAPSASAPPPSTLHQAPAPKCVSGAACFADQDCGSDNPSSFCAGGALVGTCKCAACLTGKPCKDDADCGGLMHACQADTTGLCNCRAAHKANGFPTFIDALQIFCNHRRCDGKATDECFGLPCWSGVCVCP